MKSLGDLARLTVRAAACLLGWVRGWRAPVKVVWCSGRLAKPVRILLRVDVAFEYPAQVPNGYVNLNLGWLNTSAVASPPLSVGHDLVIDVVMAWAARMTYHKWLRMLEPRMWLHPLLPNPDSWNFPARGPQPARALDPFSYLCPRAFDFARHIGF